MNLSEAQSLALDLMEKFGLGHWTFKFDKSRKRFGACYRRQRLITLSRNLVLLNPKEQVEDTIRHEIAHALTPIRGHGIEWQQMCAYTGAKPERLYDASVVLPMAPYKATCAGCNRVHSMFRCSKRRLFCAAKDCVRKYGHRQPIQKLIFVRTEDICA